MRALFSLVVLIGMGASFIGAFISLFSGQILAAFGLFVLAAMLNGIAKGLGA